MEKLLAKKGFLCDMDGVVYRMTHLLPGVREFVDWLNREGKKYLFLTNNSTNTPAALRQRLLGMGLDVTEDHFFTSAQATADFLAMQTPGARVFAIGEAVDPNAIFTDRPAMQRIDAIASMLHEREEQLKHLVEEKTL